MADEKKNTFSDTLGTIASATGFGMAANALGNAVGSIFNDMSAERAYQRQKKMFDYVSEYNSPKNQIARLKQAGIAPATAFGGINSAQSAPSMNTGNFNANNSVDPFAFQQLRNLRAEEENLRSQAFKNEAEGKKAQSQTKGQDIENDWIAKVHQNQIDLNNSLTALNGASKDKVMEEIPMIKAQTQKILQETSNLVEQSKFIGEQIKKCQEEIKNLEKQRDVYSSQILLNEQHARLARLQGDFQEINNAIKRATQSDEIHYIQSRFQRLIVDFGQGKSELNSGEWNDWVSVANSFEHKMTQYSDYLAHARRNIVLGHSRNFGMNPYVGVKGFKVGFGVNSGFSNQDFGSY